MTFYNNERRQIVVNQVISVRNGEWNALNDNDPVIIVFTNDEIGNSFSAIWITLGISIFIIIVGCLIYNKWRQRRGQKRRAGAY